MTIPHDISTLRSRASRALYPVLRTGRNLTLRLMGRRRIAEAAKRH